MKDGLVRAETLPLVFRVPGTEGFARGTRVRARITGIDLLTLDLHAVLAAKLETTPEAAAAEAAVEAEEAEAEEAPAAGPLALAIEIGAGEENPGHAPA